MFQIAGVFYDWEFAAVMLGRIGIATLFGRLIGVERANQTAGLRTHILISLGATLVMCTGEYLFMLYSRTINIHPARLGVQVVSGIDVLCTGTILKEGTTIKGLTTAAGMWVSVCIGIAVGCGSVIPALTVPLITFVVLKLFYRLENVGKKGHLTRDLGLSRRMPHCCSLLPAV